MSVASTKAFASAVLNAQDPAAKQCSRYFSVLFIGTVPSQCPG